MDLKQHMELITNLTNIFCMMPTVYNLISLQKAVREMELTCGELKYEHPDYQEYLKEKIKWGK